MSMKKIIRVALLLATGFTTGAVTITAVTQLNNRTSFVGGEVFFVPMVLLLIWFGWMLRSEYRVIKAGQKRRNMRRR